MTFTVPAGSVFGVLGPNGAGEWTFATARVAATIYEARSSVPPRMSES